MELPEISVNRFRDAEEALEITFDRDNITGKDRDKLREVVGKHYLKLLKELGLR